MPLKNAHAKYALKSIWEARPFFWKFTLSARSRLPLSESLVQWAAAAAAIPAAFYPHIPLRRALTSAARGAAGESGGELSGGAACWTARATHYCKAKHQIRQKPPTMLKKHQICKKSTKYSKILQIFIYAVLSRKNFVPNLRTLLVYFLQT